jgi:putative membrane protein
LLVREVLLRKNVVQKRGWLHFIVVCIALAISAAYEFIEWGVSLASGEGGDAFLGTQGYIWDTQSDMLFATMGAIIALLTLSKSHDNYLKAYNFDRN